jgi:hypothetical protein
VTFVVGVVLSLPGVSYLDAMDHIDKLNPGTVATVLLIVGFCLMQQLLLEIPLLGYVVAPERTQHTITRLRGWMGRRGRTAAVIGAAPIRGVAARPGPDLVVVIDPRAPSDNALSLKHLISGRGVTFDGSSAPGYSDAAAAVRIRGTRPRAGRAAEVADLHPSSESSSSCRSCGQPRTASRAAQAPA